MQLKLGQVDTVMIPCVTNTMRLLECYKTFFVLNEANMFCEFQSLDICCYVICFLQRDPEEVSKIGEIGE